MTMDGAHMIAVVEAIEGRQLSSPKLYEGPKAAPTRIPPAKASPKPESSESSPLSPHRKSGESCLKCLCSDKLLAASRQAGAPCSAAAAGQAAPTGSGTIKAAWPRPTRTAQPDASAAAAAPAPATPSTAVPAPATPTAIPRPRSCRYASAGLELKVTDSAELCQWLNSCESLLPAEGSFETQLTCAEPVPPAAAAVPRAALSGSRRTSAADSALDGPTTSAPKQLPKKHASPVPGSSRIPAAPSKAAAAAAAAAVPIKSLPPSLSSIGGALQKWKRPRQPASPSEPADFVSSAPATPPAALQCTSLCTSADQELRVTDSAEQWFVVFVPQPSDECEVPSAAPSSHSAVAAAALAAASSPAEPITAAEADASAPFLRRVIPSCTEALELLLAANEEVCAWLAAPLDESVLEMSYGGLARKYGWDCLWEEN